MQPDSRQEFGVDSICDGVDDRGAIVGGIDVHAKRSGPVPHLDHVHDRGGDVGHVRVGRSLLSQSLAVVCHQVRVSRIGERSRAQPPNPLKAPVMAITLVMTLLHISCEPLWRANWQGRPRSPWCGGGPCQRMVRPHRRRPWAEMPQHPGSVVAGGLGLDQLIGEIMPPLT